MSPTDIEEILSMSPWKPLRFTLSSGDKFIVDRQFRTALNEGGMLLAWMSEPDPATGRQLKMISTVNVAMVERLDNLPPPAKSSSRRLR